MAHYRIAGCVVEYTPVYPLLRRQMEPYRCESGAVDMVLSLNREYYRKKQEEHRHLTREQCEYLFAGAQFYRKYIKQGGFLLHASAVVMDGRAYLFSASSGVGKSTHTKLWQKKFGADRAVIINDDKPAICIEDGVCSVWGTPFSGKTDENRNEKALLQGICMLERGEENRIWQIKASEALPLLMQQTIRPRQEELADKLLTLVDALLRKIPVYRMQCTVCEEAAEIAYERMRNIEWGV